LSTEYSAIVDLSYNFDDVLQGRRRTCCRYVYVWVACHIEYYKRYYFGGCCFDRLPEIKN
jgi:hypothetical protein